MTEEINYRQELFNYLADNGFTAFDSDLLDAIQIVLSRLTKVEHEWASSLTQEVVKLFGYVFENKFYKSLDELSGRTFHEGNKPIAVYTKE